MGRDLIIFSHFARNRVSHDDCHGIICGGNVHCTNKKPHAKLSAFPAFEYAFDQTEKGGESSVFVNQSTEGGNEDSDHGSLIHAGNTVSHVAQKFCGLCGACREHDDGAGCNANQKDNKYIDADDSTNQDEQIRNNLDQVVIGMKIRRSCMP